jgi:hypothetical protein
VPGQGALIVPALDEVLVERREVHYKAVEQED